MVGKVENKKIEEFVRPVWADFLGKWAASIYNQSGYEPLNSENASFLNSDNFDATDLRF